MFYELDKADYERVRPLFRPLAYQPFCTAVLAGIHPGRAFVDDLVHPQTAFVGRADAWGFLAGNPANDAFNRALNQALFEREIVGADAFGLLCTCHPQDWGGQLTIVFSPRQPIPARRRHYVCRKLRYDWRAHVPEGFTVQRMDATLRERFRLPDNVQELLDKWRALKDDRFHDFGFVAIHRDEVVSWATVDAVVDGVGDAGLFTLTAYRRRGLATVTTAAALEHGLSHGLEKVNWTCAESNVGSIRTAEKLGFERESDYTMYYFFFDEGQHLGNLAYHHLQSKHYQEAAELFERACTLKKDRPSWVYHDAAQAWAGLGNRDKALAHLFAAVDRGWTDLDGTQRCSEFESLHGTAEWDAVLERIRQNK